MDSVWRAFVGQWGHEDNGRQADVTATTWEGARTVLRLYLEPFANDDCGDCRRRADEARAALLALTPGSEWQDEIDGEDLLLVRVANA